MIRLRFPSARLLWVILGAIALAGCGKSRAARESAITQSVEKENPFVMQFRSLYPASIGYFTHIDDDYGPTTWHSRVGLHGRYVLEMRMEVTLTPNRARILSYKNPRFMLLEAESLVKQPDGGVHMKYKGASQVDFGIPGWRALVANKGELTALGITLSTEPPLADFEQSWKEF